MKGKTDIKKIFSSIQEKIFTKRGKGILFLGGWMTFYLNFKNIVRIYRMDALIISAFRGVSGSSIVIPNYSTR